MINTALFQNFITTQRAQSSSPNADIRARWASRVIARGLHQHGRAGAATYLRDYGRGISTTKVIAFALQAENEGCADMATCFWAAAYELATGTAPVIDTDPPSPTRTATPASPVRPTSTGLPPHLQPGSIITQQAVDAAHPREYYIDDPAYIGQPKRDGNRIVIIATPERVLYQSRSTALMATPDPAIDLAFLQLASVRGPFVLDGERVFIAGDGSEHRTGSQAAHVNVENGDATIPVILQLSMFKALFADARDLTADTENARITAAEVLVAALDPQVRLGTAATARVEMVPTARTRSDKLALCALQRSESREGEIWIKAETTYIGGKAGGEAIVRTKYVHETVVLVTGLTTTDVAGRPFGAITVSEVHADGTMTFAGNVGTGFSQPIAVEIAKRFTRQTSLFITVRHQGRTENGILWHARFVGFAEVPVPSV